MVLLIGIAILVLFLLFRSKKPSVKKPAIFSGEKPSLDAAEVVRLRYARGEISFDEFSNYHKKYSNLKMGLTKNFH